MMHDGSSKPVQDIRVGDELMGDDSTPRRVLTLARGIDDMFDIVPVNSKFPTYRVTREHVLCLKWTNHGSVSKWLDYGKVVQWYDPERRTSRGTKFIHKNADAMRDFIEVLDRDKTFEMTVGEYMDLAPHVKKYFKAYRVAVEFPTRPEPKFDPWCIGAWLGDGTSAKPQITSADQEIIDGFVEALEGTGTEISFKGKYRYDIAQKDGGRKQNTNVFTAALRAYGLMNNKHIPTDLKLGSRKTRLAVLAGLLDTDGFFSGYGYDIIQKNERLADDIVFVARSLGFASTKTPCTKGCWYKGELREGRYFRLSISGDGLDDLPMRLDRKIKPETPKLRKNQLRYGFSIVPVGKEAYYGFETDGNHRFLLGDLTVTHNSTIVLKVCKNLYEALDVGILSNNIEKKFGISAFYDKNLVVAPEIRNDLAIEQAEFQSIVSGEDIQVNVKHKKAFSVEWTVPGVLAGNEVPNWADSAGSIQRRIVVFEFTKTVRNGDMKLGEKLNAELPNIIQKCNRAYLEKARAHSDVNVWTVLPSYFIKARNALAQATNSVEAFLASTDLRLDTEAFMPIKDFQDALKEFEIRNNLQPKRNARAAFHEPFEKFGLRIAQETKTYRGCTQCLEYIFGVDLARTHVDVGGLG